MVKGLFIYLFIYLFIVWSDDNLVEKYFQEEKFSFVCVSVYFLKVLHHLMGFPDGSVLGGGFRMGNTCIPVADSF